MKRILPLVLVCFLLLLTACGGQQVKSNDYHFQLTFPEDMTVFSPIETKPDDPRLAEFQISAEDLTAFGQENGLFYAIRAQGDQRDEMTVTVSDSDYDFWQLKESDTEAITEFESQMIASFEEEGFAVIHKGVLQQKDACCVFMTAASGRNDNIDLIYMATVYNGLYYAVTYQSSHAISDREKQEVYDVFETFYITETLANPDDPQPENTAARAVLVIVLIAIVAVLITLVLRFLLVRHPKHEPEQPYVPQFEDNLKQKKKDK